MSRPTGAFYCVYRARNEALVHGLLADPLRYRWPVALWALDEPVGSLAEWTRGTGPGGKFDLLNALLAEVPPRPDDHVVLCDDDITFASGGVASFVRWMRRAGLGLAQPAHAEGSLASHKFTHAVEGSNVRLTTFVEIGPMFAVAPRWRSSVLPFPADVGMGWGIELEWVKLVEQGCRLGIVDAVRVRHLVKPATDYDLATALGELHERLDAHGVSEWSQVQRELARWPRRRLRAPWPR